jgi:hypothetical protein
VKPHIGSLFEAGGGLTRQVFHACAATVVYSWGSGEDTELRISKTLHELEHKLNTCVTGGTQQARGGGGGHDVLFFLGVMLLLCCCCCSAADGDDVGKDSPGDGGNAVGCRAVVARWPPGRWS